MGDGIKLATGSRRRRQNFGLEHVELGTFKNCEYEFVRDSQKTHDLSHPSIASRRLVDVTPCLLSGGLQRFRTGLCDINQRAALSTSHPSCSGTREIHCGENYAVM